MTAGEAGGLAVDRDLETVGSALASHDVAVIGHDSTVPMSAGGASLTGMGEGDSLKSHKTTRQMVH